MSQTDTIILDPDEPGGPDELDAAAETLARALKVDWSSRPECILPGSVRKVAGLASQLMVLDAGVVGAFEGSTEWAADGHRSLSVGVRHESHQSASTSRRRVSRSRKLAHLDHLSAALAAGEVSTDAAGSLMRTDRSEVHDLFVRDEALLVDHAIHLEHVDLVAALTMWDQFADPDGADREAVDADEQRSTHASWVGDRLRVDSWMNKVGGTEWKAEIDRLGKKLFEADWADARGRLGDNATNDDLARIPAQRRHDAQVEMAATLRVASSFG